MKIFEFITNQASNTLALRCYQIVFLISVIFSVTACESSTNSGTDNLEDQPEPLGAEELGYYREFEDEWEYIVNITNQLIEYDTLLQLSIETNQKQKEIENKEELEKVFSRLKEASGRYLETLEPVLPPPSMESFHLKWLELLLATKEASSYEEIVSQSKEFITSYSSFESEFSSRPKDLSRDSGARIEFQPYLIPVRGGIDPQSGQFSLTFSSDIATPVGELSLAAATDSSSNIEELIIQHAGKVRYVALTPNSEIFVPAACGVTVKSSEAPRMVIEVLECRSAEANPDIVEANLAANTSLLGYPKSTCGDSLPRDTSAYPLEFFPVFIEFTPDNLIKVKQDFCGDAYQTIRELTGQKAIQIASFSSKEKANEFRALMEENFGNAEVGESRKVSVPPQ